MSEPTRRPDAPTASVRRVYRVTVVAAALTAVTVTVIIGVAATSWIGRPFPGFG